MAYTDSQFNQLMQSKQANWDKQLQSQQSNQSWAHNNPKSAMGLAGGAAMGGGLLSGLFGGGGLFGKSESSQQVPMFSPQIMALKDKMAPELWQQLMGGQFDFGPIEDLARQGFQQKTIPSIMNRFNMGDNRSSSAQFGALGQAGQGLDTNLAAMRQNYGLQRQNLLASLMGNAMTPSFETNMRPRQAGGIEQGMGSLMQLLPLLMMM